MDRLTHKRENGIKQGYWSSNRKEELVQCLGEYEDSAGADKRTERTVRNK